MYFNDSCWSLGRKGSFWSLNPYCNGCTSMIHKIFCDYFTTIRVSILIVMDVLQWLENTWSDGCRVWNVSILIVMDVLQWFLLSGPPDQNYGRLNPYCNGCTSMISGICYIANRPKVSILIVMDVLQWSIIRKSFGKVENLSQSLL